MKKDELLKLLNNVNEDGNTTSTFTKHSKVLLIDGLNLFLRNFAVMNYVNTSQLVILLIFLFDLYWRRFCD